MTSKGAFTHEEWERVRRAPLVAGMAITIADPGGPIEISKEGMATLRAATVPPSQEELLAAVALDIQAMIQQRHNPARASSPRPRPMPAPRSSTNSVPSTRSSPRRRHRKRPRRSVDGSS